MSRSSPLDHPSASNLVSSRVLRARPIVRATFQLAVEIPMDKTNAAATFRKAIAAVVRWMEGRFGQALPAPANAGESFAVGEWDKQVECIAIPELGTWTARLTQDDEPVPPRPAVPGRTWTTDISLWQQPQSIGVAIRCFCTSRPDCQDEVALTRPEVVVDLAAAVGLSEIRPLDGRPWLLQTAADLAALRGLLVDPRRTLPVILLTQPDRFRYPVRLSEFVLDAPVLARRVQGLAHVVLLPHALSHEWTQLVGQSWSAYLGAVRTYRPGLDFDEELPSAHPRTFIDRILFWRHGDLQGEAAFLEFLVEQTCSDAATRRIDWGDCIFITDARARMAEISRTQVQQRVIGKRSMVEEIAELRLRIEELEAAHFKELAALKARIAEAQEEAARWSDDSVKAGRDREYYAEENRKLRAQVDMLRAHLSARTGQAPDAAVPIPDRYSDLPDWVATHLTGRLELHPRALRGVKSACYQDVGLVYRALLLLANEYRNMRLGLGGAKGLFDAAIRSLGLRHAFSIDEARAGHEGDEYFVRYPLGTQSQRFLEFHLRKGATKDQRYCLAIYFFWDEQTRRVIVGWLPSHLDTRQT